MNHNKGNVIPGQNIEQLLRRGVAEVIIKEELRQLLSSGRRLRLKEGFDPSAPDIHLGHMVALRKLHQLQELGHQVVLIVGDWTARIGDPTGVSVTRPMLSEEQVDVGRALRGGVRPLHTFEVTCPATGAAPRTRQVQLDP